MWAVDLKYIINNTEVALGAKPVKAGRESELN